MNRLFRTLTGYDRATFSSHEPEKILNFCLWENIPIWGIERKEGTVSFSLARVHRAHLFSFSLIKGKETLSVTYRGLPAIAYRYRKRYGLMAGGVLSALMLYIGTGLVWSLEIPTGQAVPAAVIREQFFEAGIRPGARIASFDPEESALQFQVEHPEYSFVSLNVIGTKVVAELRCQSEKGQIEDSGEKCNIVAKKSGKIVRFEVLDGTVMVKRGELVPEGALLISGISDRKNGSYRLSNAKGSVFAETDYEWTVSIPYDFARALFTGRERKKTSYSMLGVTISVSGGGQTFESEKEIVTEEDVFLFGFQLPIRKKVRLFLETEEKIERITVDTARVLAYDKYEEYKRDNFDPRTEFLEESVDFSETDTGIIARFYLKIVEDIGRSKPFQITD